MATIHAITTARKHYQSGIKLKEFSLTHILIKSLTYLVNDIDTLDLLEDKLKESLELLDESVPKEDGIITLKYD